MCNINVIIRRDGTKGADITECMNVVSFNSFLHNKDAEGFFYEDFKVTKSEQKKVMRGIHSMCVSHQRVSTSGKNAKMAQPIETDSFIVTHNGVFTGLGTHKESDTFKYANKLEEYYKELKDTTKAVQKLNSETAGYYSVVLYNKVTEEFLYYKEACSSMYLAMNKDYIFMSTDENNVKYMNLYFNVKLKISEVNEDNIYDFKKGLKSIGTFETYTYPVVKSSTWEKDDNEGDTATGVRQLFGSDRDYGRPKISGRHVDVLRENFIDVLEDLRITWDKAGFHGDTGLVTIARTDEDLFVSTFRSAYVARNKADKVMYRVEVQNVKEVIAEHNSEEGYVTVNGTI